MSLFSQFGNWFGWSPASTPPPNVEVNPRTVISIAAVRRCVDAIASDLASMPLELVRITDKDEEIPAADHPAYALFKWSPDGGVSTPYRWRQSMVSNALTWGDGLAEIGESRDKSTPLLHILQPGGQPGLDKGKLVYNVGGKTIDGSKVIHLACLGFDGLRGWPPWMQHARSFGLTIAAEQLGASFLGNGGFAGGFFEADAQMTEEDFRNFREEYDKRHAGPGKAGKPGLIPPGFTFNKATVDPQSAQLMELRLFQILECGRIYGVPPHRLMQYENMHYSTVEAVKSEFAQTTLLPWASNFEQSLNLRLLTREEILSGLTFRHDFREYLRADAVGRAAMYKVMGDLRSIQVNEVRAQEGYRRLPDGDVVPEPPAKPVPPKDQQP